MTTVAEKGPLRDGTDIDSAVDLLWLYMSPDLYFRLVHERGWPADRFRAWLADTLRRLLLPAPHEALRDTPGPG